MKSLHRTGPLVALLLLSLCANVAAEGDPETTVYPTGRFPLDVQNVQAAISLGGVVRLKAVDIAGNEAAFNFGPADVSGGFVVIRNDVALVGERQGLKMATISGGYIPVFSRLAVKTRIESIAFESPLGAAILLLASGGTDIVGNHINAVVGIRLRFGTDGDGIDLFGNNDPANAFTGKVRIADNVIENLTADFANGVQLDEVSATVELTGNKIVFQRSLGRIQTIGITAFRSHNEVTIAGNEVTMGAGSNRAFPVPIFVSGDLDARYVIVRNNVVNQHPSGDGIEVTGGDFSQPTQKARIGENRVQLNSISNPYSAGIAVFGAVNKSSVYENRIDGTGGNALQVAEGNFATSLADGNVIVDNHISGFEASVADVYLGTNSSNTRFEGRCESYVDLGVSNRITCKASRANSVASIMSRSTTLPSVRLGIISPDLRQSIVEARMEKLTR